MAVWTWIECASSAVQRSAGADRVPAYGRDEIVSMKPLGHIAAMSYVYPCFDPLRLLLPRTVATWPGPPDLEFDFYRGLALSGAPVMREVAVGDG